MNLLNGQAHHEYLVALWIASPTCMWEDMGQTLQERSPRLRIERFGFAYSDCACSTSGNQNRGQNILTSSYWRLSSELIFVNIFVYLLDIVKLLSQEVTPCVYKLIKIIVNNTQTSLFIYISRYFGYCELIKGKIFYQI